MVDKPPSIVKTNSVKFHTEFKASVFQHAADNRYHCLVKQLTTLLARVQLIHIQYSFNTVLLWCINPNLVHGVVNKFTSYDKIRMHKVNMEIGN